MTDPKIKAVPGYKPKPVRVTVEAIGSGSQWWQVWIGQSRRTSPLGPPLNERGKAVRIACKLTAALRDEKVPVATVATIIDALALRDYIDEEIETEIAVLGDMKHSELVQDALDPSKWVASLGTIKVDNETGLMALDYDQATAVQELLPTILEAVEDYDVPYDPIPTTLALLRGYARQLEAAGFPFERAFGPDGKYVIKLADESQGDPYVIWENGGEVATVRTLMEGWELIQEWAAQAAPPPLKLPEES